MKKTMKFLLNWIDSSVMHLPISIAVVFISTVFATRITMWENLTLDEAMVLLFFIQKTFLGFTVAWGFVSAWFGRGKDSFFRMGYWAFEVMLFFLGISVLYLQRQSDGKGLVETLFHGPIYVRGIFLWCIYAAISETIRYRYHEYRRKNRHKIKTEKNAGDVIGDISWSLSSYHIDNIKQITNRRFEKKRAVETNTQTKPKTAKAETVKAKNTKTEKPKQTKASKKEVPQNKTENQVVKKEASKENPWTEYRNVLTGLQEKGYRIFVLKNNFTLVVSGKNCCVLKCVDKEGKYLFENDSCFLNGKKTTHFGMEIQSVSAKLRAQCSLERTFGMIVKCFKQGQIAGKSGFRVMNVSGAADVLRESVVKHTPKGTKKASDESCEKIKKAFRDEILQEGV